MSFVDYQLYDLHKLRIASLQGSVLVCFNTGLARITWRDTFMWRLFNLLDLFLHNTKTVNFVWLERYLLLGKHSAKWAGLYHALYISQGRIWDCFPFLIDVDFIFCFLHTISLFQPYYICMHFVIPADKKIGDQFFSNGKWEVLRPGMRFGVVQQKTFHP